MLREKVPQLEDEGYSYQSERNERINITSDNMKQYCQIYSIYTVIKNPLAASVAKKHSTELQGLSYHPMDCLHFHNSHKHTQQDVNAESK